eukprot:g12797.t1
MGSKRPRPWSRQSSGSSNSVAAAAAAFALAALSLPEAGALSGSCASTAAGRSDSSSRTRRWGDSSGGVTCVAGRRDGPGHPRKARLVLSSGGGGAATGHVRSPSRGSGGGGHVRSAPRQSSPSAVLPLASDREDGTERNGCKRSVGLRDGSAPPPIPPAISVAHVLEQPQRSPASPRTPWAATSGSTRAGNNGGAPESKAIKTVHRWKSDNDVRMFLMERGLSQWEVRKVLPVMRRDAELVKDVATLAARMQAIADLLEAAVSWYSPEGEAVAGVSEETAVDAASEGAGPWADSCKESLPSVLTSTELRSGGAGSWNRIRTGRQEEDSASRHLAPGWLTGGGNSDKEDGGKIAEGMAAMRLYDGDVESDCNPERKEHHATPPTEAVASVDDPRAAVAADRAEGGGPRLHAYQLVSSEPRLLLLRAEPDLSDRLRFLLDMLPGLREGYWNGRLRRAAPLLAIDTVKLQGRLEGLVEIFPDHVDLQAVLNQAPLLLRHRTETVAAAVANIERLIPGLRVERLLRSAPYILVQPLDVVEKRLAHLRKVLGLTPSPELEKMRISFGIPKSSCSSDERRGGRGGGHTASVRTLARFANAFPQILTMEPHTVRAKIKGLEELLPGMDGLAVVSSRPHLLGFSVRQNVSLKVSSLRALMKRERAGPEESRQEQPEQHQQHQALATAGSDLAAAVARCPSLLTLSSETAARKVEELQEVLPPGLDARAVVAKEPRVLALDTASTVPRKLDGLTRALAAHSLRGNDDEAVAAAAAQVLRYFPNALRLDPATLAGKLEALRLAGLSSETVLSVVGGAPRCLSAAAGTLEQRVSTLKEAFPSACVDGMLRKAPGLLQNRVDPGARLKVLQELFPSLKVLRLVEGAPMLLALSESTLRAKSEAWRHVLEARVGQPWEQAIAEFPQLLCQGLGRAARIEFLLLPAASSATAAAVPAAVAPSASASDDGGAVGTATGSMAMSAATACREVCRRVTDFERDHPAYPAFLDSLLLAACRRPADGARVARDARGDGAVRERKEPSPNSASPVLAMGRGVMHGGVALDHADVGALAETQRHAAPRAGTAAATISAAKTHTAESVPNRQGRMEAPTPPPANNGQQKQQQRPRPGTPSASPLLLSTPAEDIRVTVTSEKALGAAMTAAAKGPGGGRDAAAMLLLGSVEIQSHAVQSIVRGRKPGSVSLDHLPAPSVNVAKRALVSCQQYASKQRRAPERTSRSALPPQQGLSTSAGAAAAGTGEDDAGFRKGGSTGNGEARVLERKSDAETAAAPPAGVPVDVRGAPRPKQRVDVELGTFHEFTAVNKNGGKIFEASRKLIPAKDAVVFPAVEVSNLASDDSAGAAEGVDFLKGVLAGRVTMVGLFHRQFGYSMLPSWTEPFEEAFPSTRQGGKVTDKVAASTPTTPCALSLSLLESWPLRMLKPLLVNTMGRGLSPEQRESFFYRFGPTEEVRKALGIANRLTLYVLLVDQEGRVRWQGTGKGTPDEVELLIRCARQLAAEGGNGGEGGAEAEGGAGARGRQGKSGKKEGDLPSFEDEVDDDAGSPPKSSELGRVPKEEPSATMSSRSSAAAAAAAAAAVEECGPTSTSCPVSRLLATISRPESARESKLNRVQAANGAAVHHHQQQQRRQQQQQPADAGDSRSAAGTPATQAPAAAPAPKNASTTKAASSPATATTSTPSKDGKKKRRKKKTTAEKPKNQQDRLLSPAEPPPVPKTQARAVRPKKILFESKPSLRDDPRRLLGNYGEAFAVDAISSCSSGEEDEAEGDDADTDTETDTDKQGPEEGVNTRGTCDDSAAGGQPAVHVSRGGAMPTPPPATRLGITLPVKVAAEGRVAFATAGAAVGPGSDDVRRDMSLDLMAGGAGPIAVNGRGSCNVSARFSDAATSPAVPAAPAPTAAAAAAAATAAAAAAAPATTGPAGFLPYAAQTILHDGFAYPAVSEYPASTKALHLEDPFPPAAPPPPRPAQHEHQDEQQRPRFLSGRDEPLAAGAPSGGSPRGSGYSAANVSVSDSLSPASPASRAVSPPAAQAAAVAAAAEPAACYSPTSALPPPPPPPPPPQPQQQQQQQQQQRQQQHQQRPVAVACVPSSAASMTAAVQAEARRRLGMMRIPAGRDFEFQHQPRGEDADGAIHRFPEHREEEGPTEGPERPDSMTPRDHEHHQSDGHTDNTNSSTTAAAGNDGMATTKKKNKKKNSAVHDSKKGSARTSGGGGGGGGGGDNDSDRRSSRSKEKEIGADIGDEHDRCGGAAGDGGSFVKFRGPITPRKYRGNKNRNDYDSGTAGNRDGPACAGDRPPYRRDPSNDSRTSTPSTRRARISGASSSSRDDRPPYSRDSSNDSRTTTPSARRARVSGAGSSSRDARVSSSCSPTGRRKGETRSPQESERRRTPPRAGRRRGREEPEEMGRRHREEGEIELGREGKFDRRSLVEKRQEENRRIFAEQILALVKMNGGPVHVQGIRAAISFTDLGTTMKNAFQRGMIKGVRSWRDNGIIWFGPDERPDGRPRNQPHNGGGGAERGSEGSLAGGRAPARTGGDPLDYYGPRPSSGSGPAAAASSEGGEDGWRRASPSGRPSNEHGREHTDWRSGRRSSGSPERPPSGARRFGSGGGGSGERGRAGDRRRDRRSSSRSKDPRGRDLDGKGRVARSRSKSGDGDRDRRRRGRSRSRSRSGSAGSRNNRSGGRAISSADDRGSGPASGEKKRKLGDGGAGSGKKTGGGVKVKKAKGGKAASPGTSGKSPASAKSAKKGKGKKNKRQASPGTPDGAEGAGRRGEGSDGGSGGGGSDGNGGVGEEGEVNLPQDGVTALLKSVAQSSMNEEDAKHGEESAKADAGSPATEENKAAHAGAGAGGEVEKNNKIKRRKITVATAGAPAAPLPPPPLASFLRIAKDTAVAAAVVDGDGEAPSTKGQEEAAALTTDEGGGGRGVSESKADARLRGVLEAIEKRGLRADREDADERGESDAP